VKYLEEVRKKTLWEGECCVVDNRVFTSSTDLEKGEYDNVMLVVCKSPKAKAKDERYVQWCELVHCFDKFYRAHASVFIEREHQVCNLRVLV